MRKQWLTDVMHHLHPFQLIVQPTSSWLWEEARYGIPKTRSPRPPRWQARVTTEGLPCNPKRCTSGQMLKPWRTLLWFSRKKKHTVSMLFCFPCVEFPEAVYNFCKPDRTVKKDCTRNITFSKFTIDFLTWIQTYSVLSIRHIHQSDFAIYTLLSCTCKGFIVRISKRQVATILRWNI